MAFNGGAIESAGSCRIPVMQRRVPIGELIKDPINRRSTQTLVEPVSTTSGA
jgi:hypothetical protein